MSEAVCTYQHRGWSRPCSKAEGDPIHYELGGSLRPPYAAYSGPVRHPFNASARWSPWFVEQSAKPEAAVSAGADPRPSGLRQHYEHWRFFADHPLPWELSDTSAGFAVEDANHEVLWRFDHYDRGDVERFVASLNDVVSVEEAPYIRGYNRGWEDAEARAQGGPYTERHHTEHVAGQIVAALARQRGADQ